MRQATVQPPAPPNVYEVPIESEGSVRLRALSDQQEHSIIKLVQLEAQRNSYQHQVTTQTGARKQEFATALAGTEAEIAGLKQTIAEGREQIAQLQGAAPVVVAGPTGLALVQPVERVFGMNRTEFGMVAGLAVTLPLVIALARMMWRCGSRSTRMNPVVDDARFTRLEQAVESVAIEIERIGEAQRFSAKLLAERQADGIAVHSRDESIAPKK